MCLDYVTSVFHLVDARKRQPDSATNHVNDVYDPDSSDPDDTFAAARSFILAQKEGAAAFASVRGPFLAEIEFKCRIAARREEDEEAWGEVRLLDLLCSYFARFGAKQVCAFDLKLYMSSLDASEQQEFLKRGRETVEVDSKGVPTSVRPPLT